MDTVIIIPAIGDNFVYLCRYSEANVFAVDPGDAGTVLSCLEDKKLNLDYILVTHHHWDHTAGVGDLKKRTGCRLISPDGRVAGTDHVVINGEVLDVDGVQIQVISTPGHTKTSVSYYIPKLTTDGNPAVFTGDTMFAGGCGRILECDAHAMWNSLCKLASLPDDTCVYPGHDYTIEDYEFFLTIDPDNTTVREQLKKTRQKSAGGQLTVPITISSF